MQSPEEPRHRSEDPEADRRGAHSHPVIRGAAQPAHYPSAEDDGGTNPSHTDPDPLLTLRGHLASDTLVWLLSLHIKLMFCISFLFSFTPQYLADWF